MSVTSVHRFEVNIEGNRFRVIQRRYSDGRTFLRQVRMKDGASTLQMIEDVADGVRHVLLKAPSAPMERAF